MLYFFNALNTIDMLQYILNLSAVWLLSLIVFDAFLRKDTYHTYNRLYLLFTLTMGICFPFYSWQSDAVVYNSNIGKPMLENAAVIKQSVIESETAETIFDGQQYLLIAYAIGVFVGLLLMLKDLFLIIRLYNKGDKTKDGVWTIIETGKQHTPFSAFRYVFISSKENYSADELRMILSHEEQHGHLLHFIDLLFIQFAKIIFWFHPLIYIYHNRLITVHEYQADAAVDKTPATYGQFLVEQAILQSAPALTHSFNRSPIKKRILMLTRKTPTLAKSKTLVIAPLILICLLCFTKNAFSDDKRIKNGNKVTFRGNVFEYPPAVKPDTSTVVNSETGEETIKITERVPTVIKMNGKRIYYEIYNEDGTSAINGINTMGVVTAQSLKQYLMSNLKEEIKKLKDGTYYFNLEDVVLNEKGKIVYYSYDSIYAIRASKTDELPVISKQVQDMFNRKISRLLDNIPSKVPATVDGKPVLYRPGNVIFGTQIVVKDGVAISY
jgi:hypothetical protein